MKNLKEKEMRKMTFEESVKALASEIAESVETWILETPADVESEFCDSVEINDIRDWLYSLLCEAATLRFAMTYCRKRLDPNYYKDNDDDDDDNE
jgi:hypothetical protein